MVAMDYIFNIQVGVEIDYAISLHHKIDTENNRMFENIHFNEENPCVIILCCFTV